MTKSKRHLVVGVRFTEEDYKHLSGLVRETGLTKAQILTTAIVNTADEIFELMKKKRKAIN
jgi:predicted DNA-binding protein